MEGFSEKHLQLMRELADGKITPEEAIRRIDTDILSKKAQEPCYPSPLWLNIPAKEGIEG